MVQKKRPFRVTKPRKSKFGWWGKCNVLIEFHCVSFLDVCVCVCVNRTQYSLMINVS